MNIKKNQHESNREKKKRIYNDNAEIVKQISGKLDKKVDPKVPIKSILYK